MLKICSNAKECESNDCEQKQPHECDIYCENPFCYLYEKETPCVEFEG